MASAVLDLVVLLFEYISVIVACMALALAIKWKKTEFFAGLFFLLLYTVLDAIELSLITVFDVSMVNASQFGFILIAILAFILGMRPAEVIKKPG